MGKKLSSAILTKNQKQKAFTMLELIFVIFIIAIIIMSTTVYLWIDDKRKIIESQWCVTTIWWELHNFLFYALTSKKLRLDEETTVSPEFYIIQLTWSTSETGNCINTWAICDEILLRYDTWDGIVETYSRPSLKSCHWGLSRIGYYRSWDIDIKQVTMNKWFAASTDNPYDKKVFWLEDFSGNKLLLWDIIVVLCVNENCTEPKQISRLTIDWRSETIAIKNCNIYQDEDSNLCEQREWEFDE